MKKKYFLFMFLVPFYGSFAQTKISVKSLDKYEVNVALKLGTANIEQFTNEYVGNSTSFNISFANRLGNLFYLSTGLNHTSVDINNAANLMSYKFVQIPIQIKTDLLFMKETESVNNGYISAGIGWAPNYLYEVSNSNVTTGWNLAYMGSIAFKYELSDAMTASLGFEGIYDITEKNNFRLKNSNNIFLSFGYKF